MRALCWKGINQVRTEYVPEPVLADPSDAIVRVRLSSACGSDLQLLNGNVPQIQPGDILGHEFIGDVVEVGREVKNINIGDRIIVPSIVACGRCHYCARGEASLCDNSNPNEPDAEHAWTSAIAGAYGYSRAFGGYGGSHAEYVRVPFADHNSVAIPENVSDESAVFISDTAPSGYMAAEMCELNAGAIVAVWGCGAVGLMAIQCAYLLGAERVIAIDRVPERLRIAESLTGAEVLNYELVNIAEALHELTAGRGPDACIDAAGMPTPETPAGSLARWATWAPVKAPPQKSALDQAIESCRKGSVVSVVGLYADYLERFPLGVAINKGLRLRLGRPNGQKYASTLLRAITDGRLNPAYLVSHRLPLEQGAHGYEIFRKKRQGCLRVVFDPRLRVH